ncbi:MAG: energy transducer TonB [Schleiferiaceae bacterium]|nr:energy transducer TonB [Schleiferiaceae bacterium]
MNRKNPEVDLEKKKGLYGQIGLVVALGVIWAVLSWKTYEPDLIDLGEVAIILDDEIIPITQRQTTPPPPPPSAPAEVIQIVDDEIELEDFEFEPVDTDPVDIVEFVETVGEVSDEIFNFAVVENRPVFPGCENEPTEEAKFQCFQQSLMRFVGKEFKFPEMARKMGISGKVFVTFVIEKDGSISNVVVARGVDKLLDDEAIRVVKKIPNMTPAKQRGKPVRMSYTLPINAKIQ